MTRFPEFLGIRYNRPVTEKVLLRHATRMAVVTMVSRLTGWIRDKALFWVLGASDLNDAFRVAFRIPNAFRALLAEGALHAAFVPALSPLAGRDEKRREAQELICGLLAVLLAGLSVAQFPLLHLILDSIRTPPQSRSLLLMQDRLAA